ncbi:hypothetical protein Q1695_006487 [Nippostrongylus brasiliensis]|nr:hypothetical protein Q1695_006487 [Nippostrongylus brasiliensis]
MGFSSPLYKGQPLRPNLLCIYNQKKYAIMAVIVNAIIVADWTATALITMTPREEFTALFRDIALRIAQVDLTFTSHFGLQPSVLYQNPVKLILFSQFYIITISLVLVIIYCTYKIVRTLTAAVSPQTKRMHKEMFHLLLYQLLNPVTFLYIPFFASSTLATLNMMNVDKICALLCALYSIFPVINPLITIRYVKEYRVFLKRMIRSQLAKGHGVTTHTVTAVK